jgi:hypothetical protein
MDDMSRRPVDAETPALTLRPATVGLTLALSIMVLLVLHLLSQVLRFGFGYEYQMGFHERVYLGSELNIPSWFSSSVMLLCGIVLLWIARVTRQRGQPAAPYWAALGAIFVLLSMDEAASLHEMLSPVFAGTMIRLGETFGGIFVPLGAKGDRYAWVIPGAIGTLILGLVFLRFLAMLPTRTRWLFVLAGTVFVTGALGFEIAGGRYSGLHGADNPTFVMIMTIEETLEKAGVSLFLYALLRHAETEFGAITLRFGGAPLKRVPRAA